MDENMQKEMMEKAAEAAGIITKAFNDAIVENVSDEDLRERILITAGINMMQAAMDKMRQEFLGETPSKTEGNVTDLSDFLKSRPPFGN